MMLLGISFMLFGAILILDSSTNIGGIDYILVLSGFIISLTGFFLKEKVS